MLLEKVEEMIIAAFLILGIILIALRWG